ncbi:MAG: O-methyltransferase [Deltaproteobacteria bacterium]|nr:O-methyltransferase [Deltaproteobacteria bacterium]MCK5709902.1 O-methyltransferase [Deltaproteobacteria bacterium]
MEELAKKREIPIVGRQVGSLLYQLAITVKAKRIFELGSAFGYSAYWFAKAVGKDGQVVFTDLSRDNIELAKKFIERAGFQDTIQAHLGDGAMTLDKISGEFDIIFNDIEKEDYPQVIDKAYDKLSSGGLFITDNVLWHGRVISQDDSAPTEGVREFTKLLMSHKGFYTTIIPIRDGLSISVKL